MEFMLASVRNAGNMKIKKDEQEGENEEKDIEFLTLVDRYL
jgi:hypothetical protein